MATQCKLTDEQLQELFDIKDPGEVVVKFYLMAGVDLRDPDMPPNSFDPTNVQLESEQWQIISQHLLSIGDMPWALTWMNIGPSSYDEED